MASPTGATTAIDLFGDFGLSATAVRSQFTVEGENIFLSFTWTMDARFTSRPHSYDEIKFQ